jgi:hypothetical protein
MGIVSQSMLLQLAQENETMTTSTRTFKRVSSQHIWLWSLVEPWQATLFGMPTIQAVLEQSAQRAER